MQKLVLCLTAASLVWSAPQPSPAWSEAERDAAIARVFGNQASASTPSGQNSQSVACTLGGRSLGECVPYYLCNNNVGEDGVGLVDISQRGDCPSYMDVCCAFFELRSLNDPIVPPPEKVTPREGCGWRNPKGIGFHTKGDNDNDAKFGEFPWMVAIIEIERLNEAVNMEIYVGGGSLIHPSVVLTAAHNVARKKNLLVRAGEWDTQTTKEIYPTQDRNVSEVVVHENFNKKILYNDIALLFLATPMELAPNVGVVCLAPPGGRVSGGTRCLASGWGKDKFGQEGRYQTILKKVELPAVEHGQCQAKLRTTRLGYYFELHRSFMCAGGGKDKDTCTGDGGSPLVCPITFEDADRYMQSGIVAWGIGCGQDGTPGVYVDVSEFSSWIDNKVVAKGYDPQVYMWGVDFKGL